MIDKNTRNLFKNKRYFDNCLLSAEGIIEAGKLEEAAKYLHELAGFAWGNCTGYYVNWQLENCLNKIGKSLPIVAKKKDIISDRKRPKVLHVATEVYDVGGHTRLMLNWIKNNEYCDHSIVLTSQKTKFPDLFIEKLSVNKSIFTFYNDNDTILRRAQELREKCQEYDYIILHIHPNDVIPVIAFSVDGLPPVGFLNHADHIFWIGASILDLLIQIRESNLEIDKIRRDISTQVFLPIPIPDVSITSEENYFLSREKVGVDKEKVMLLSIGSEYKFAPIEGYNFFEAVMEVLNQNRNAILYLVGVAANSGLAIQYNHPQIVYLGDLTDKLPEYEKACDIYLEGFPYGSITAMLQPGKRGKPIHLMPNPFDLVTFFSKNTNPIFNYSSNLEEWREKLNILIRNKEKREIEREQQLKFLLEVYGLKPWKNKIQEVYKLLNKQKHTIKKMKSSKFYQAKDEKLLVSTVLPFGNLHHFGYTFKLPLRKRINHMMNLINKPSKVYYFKSDFVKYLLGKGQ